MRDLIASLRIAEIADLVVVWMLVSIALISLRATRARMALFGMGIVLGIYLAADRLDLELTTQILQGFLAVSVLVIVVVFQEDLRRLFEQIATIGLQRRPLAAVVDGVDTLSRALVRLTERKEGALVVIPGREPLEPHLDGGVALDARISEPLLLSLFDPSSPGHDGAVVLAGDRVALFAVHLPLSSDHAQLGQRGTRHAAGLGLAERCDALCLIASEERGRISVAHAGKLRELRSPSDVSTEIRKFLTGLAPGAERGGPQRSVLSRWREGLLAVPLSALLWVLAIPGGTVIEMESEFPVTLRGLSDQYALESVEPETVTVRLEGRRRDLFLLDPDDVTVPVDVILVNLGRRSFGVSPDEVRAPAGIAVLSVEPDTIKISVRENGPEEPSTP